MITIREGREQRVQSHEDGNCAMPAALESVETRAPVQISNARMLPTRVFRCVHPEGDFYRESRISRRSARYFSVSLSRTRRFIVFCTPASKMDASAKNSASTTIYQCIACEMTTDSLSNLHSHQTYRHTTEELSLLAIGLQCVLISNLQPANNLVYDNSWLCDPAKQAEFYTVSAQLLSQSSDNGNGDNQGKRDKCAPIDYAVKKACQMNEDAAEKDIFPANVSSFSFESEECSKQTKNESAIEKQGKPATLEKNTQTDDSMCICTDPNGTPKYVGIDMENSYLLDKDLGPFVNCAEELCNDLRKLQEKPQRGKRSARKIAGGDDKLKEIPKRSKKKVKVDSDVPMNDKTVPEEGNQTKLCMEEKHEENLEKPKLLSTQKNDLVQIPSGERETPLEKSGNQTIPNSFKDTSGPPQTPPEPILNTTTTFPWYPPDITDNSILVLDPEAQELVWTTFTLVNTPGYNPNDVLYDINVLPEITEANLQDNRQNKIL